MDAVEELSDSPFTPIGSGGIAGKREFGTRSFPEWGVVATRRPSKLIVETEGP